MARAGGEPPDHSGLRASDEDRDRVIDNLKAAFVRGRLDRDEFDSRVGQVLTGRTHTDLAAVTADIPDEVTGTSLPPAKVRHRWNPPVKTTAAIVVAATDAGAFALAISGAAPAVVLVILFMLAVGMTGTALVAALVCGLKLIEGYSARRSGGQLPPSPNATRRGPQRTNRAATPGRRPHTDRGSRYPVESVHGRHFRPHLARLLLPPKGRPQSA
jgi:hypothetical protein